MPDPPEPRLGSTVGAADFLRSLRHDLRTRLNHIVGDTEMLLEGAEAKGETALVDDLARIQAAGQQLLDGINEFLEPTTFTLESLFEAFRQAPQSDTARHAG